MMQVEIRFPHVRPLLVLTVILMLAAVSTVLLWCEYTWLPRFGSLHTQTKLAALLFAPAFLAFFLYVTVQTIYARSALTTDYIISEAGIAIHTRREVAIDVPWAQIHAGTYRRFSKLLTLRAPPLEQPIVLMNNKKYESPEWCAARDLLVAKLGSRLVTKWL